MLSFLKFAILFVLLAVSSATFAADPQPAATTPNSGLSLLPGTPNSAPASAMTLGTLEPNKVTSESNPGKAAQSRLKELQTKLQKQIDGKKRQLDKFKGDLERQLPALSPQQREAKAKEFQKKVEEFQKFALNAEKEMAVAQDKQLKEVFSAMEQAAIAVGKKRNLAAVVIKREMLYLGQSVEVVEITDEVISIMNQPSPTK